MATALLQRLDHLARHAAPAAVSLVLVIAGVVPLGIPFWGPVAPDYALIAVYFWSVHRPDLLPFSVVFGLGLAKDVLLGTPLGGYAVIYLICRWLVASQRRFLADQALMVGWVGFALVSAVAAGLGWAVFSVYFATPMPANPLLSQMALGVAMYPLIAGLLMLVNRPLSVLDSTPP